MRLRVVDSHTAGEPTRVILEGQVALLSLTMVERRAEMALQFEVLCNGIVREPRGSDVVVCALLTPPVNPGSVAGVIFFNNVGVLHMCGHGTIGVAETLAYLGKIECGTYAIDTSVGTIEFSRSSQGEVALRNVESYRLTKGISVATEFGTITGDIAWGGNWFFIVHLEVPTIEIKNIAELTRLTLAIKSSLARDGITGLDGAEIDHIELSGRSDTEGVNERNFVLCPGGAFDRSPCGTGTSAKMACLAEDGFLTPDTEWVQESITGGIFRGSVSRGQRGWLPIIRGRAFVTAESVLVFHPDDPYREGLVTS